MKMSIDVTQVSQELKIRPEIYVKILSSFAESLSGKMNTLNTALAANDTDQARMILHEIKGTSSNLRAHDLLSAESILHEAVKEGDSQKNLIKYFEKMSQEVIRLQQFVHVLNKSE